MATQSRYVQTHVAGESANWTDGAATGASDDNCAENSKNGGYGVYSFEGSLFDLPAGATINGIEVTTRRAVGDADDVYLIALHDGIAYQEKIGTNPSQTLCADGVDETLGNSTDTWGGTWTRTYINSIAFKVRVTHNATGQGSTLYVDSIYVTIHYTLDDMDVEGQIRVVTGSRKENAARKYTFHRNPAFEYTKEHYKKK